MCTEELDVDEPLDDDEEPLDDELPDEDDDVVLSSSLSTSFFARRGLSLTPPRRGLSLMPRPSIVYVGRRRMVMGIGAVRLGCPSWLSRPRLSRLCRAAALGAGLGLARWPGRRTSLERPGVRGDGLRRLPCCSDEFGCLLVSYWTLACFLALLCEHSVQQLKWPDDLSSSQRCTLYTLH